MSENTRKRAVPQKEKDANKAHKAGVLAAVSGMTAEVAVKKVTEAGLAINKTLGDVNTQVTSLVDEMRKLDEAIRIKQEELNTIHGKEQALREIDQLQADYELKQGELNEEMVRLQREIDQTRAQATAEMAREKEAVEVIRKRNEEEYAYNSSQAHRQQEDAFQEKMRQMQRDLANTKVTYEAHWAARESELKHREQELEDLRKQVAEFPSVLKKEVDTASAIVGNRVNSEWELKVTLLQKDRDTDAKVSASTIKSLEEQNNRLTNSIVTLHMELADSKKQVQSIAEKALESASSTRALAEVQGVMQQREGSSRSK